MGKIRYDFPKSALLIGRTRTGKSADMLISTAVDFDGAWFGIDPKLEVYRVVRRASAKARKTTRPRGKDIQTE